MEDSLVALAEAARGRRPGSTWAELVAELAQAVGSRLQGRVEHADGDRLAGRLVRVGPRAGVGRTTEVTVAAWRRDDLSGARIAATVRAAIERRQEAAEAHRLALLMVVAGPGASDARDALWLHDDLLAGFDAVALGFVDEAEEWTVLRRAGVPERVSSFEAALPLLTTVPPAPAPRPREPGPGEPGLVPEPVRPPHVLLVAGEWGSKFGGLSTLNRDLAVALAEAGVVVHVCVPVAAAADVELAGRLGVNLVAPDPIPGLEDATILLAGPRVPEDYRPDIIVGHGRHYGPYAYGLQTTRFRNGSAKPKRVQVVHVDPEQLEAAKEEPGGPSRMMIADERRTLERRLCVEADLVAGVGPLLTESIRDAMRGHGAHPDVYELRPGLPDWEPVDPADPPSLRRVLLIARAEDVRSKGIDLAVRALVEVTDRQSDPGRTPILTIRGVPEDTAEDEDVREQLKALAGDKLKLTFRPYTVDEEAIRADLWSARVAIMPSRHEGFGLAGYEAIAAGVPVRISQESGLARMLTKILGGTPEEVVQVRGTPADVERAWANSIGDALADPKQAFERAAWLRARLHDEVSWAKSVDGLLRKLGIDPASLTPRRRVRAAGY